MDTELEKKIEQLEQQRDNAMRIRYPLVAKRLTNLPKRAETRVRTRQNTQSNDYRCSNQDNQQV